MKELTETYGDFSVEAIINRWKNFPFGDKNFYEPDKNFSESEDKNNFVKSENESNFSEPEVFQPTQPSRPVGTSIQKNKFSPVNIASLIDWAVLRTEALGLNDLINFFKIRTDQQSSLFLKTIEKYKESVEKNLYDRKRWIVILQMNL